MSSLGYRSSFAPLFTRFFICPACFSSEASGSFPILSSLIASVPVTVQVFSFLSGSVSIEIIACFSTRIHSGFLPDIFCTSNYCKFCKTRSLSRAFSSKVWTMIFQDDDFMTTFWNTIFWIFTSPILSSSVARMATTFFLKHFTSWTSFSTGGYEACGSQLPLKWRKIKVWYRPFWWYKFINSFNDYNYFTFYYFKKRIAIIDFGPLFTF